MANDPFATTAACPAGQPTHSNPVEARWFQSAWVLLGITSLIFFGCRTKYRDDLDYTYGVQQSWSLDDLNHGDIVQFESVFWEPDDTHSLRRFIVDDMIAAGREVLEIGTGTGVLSILCLQGDAKRVVATDINPAAVANAKYNAAMLVPDQQLEVRQVPTDRPQAFSVIAESERFDLILSNPPWEDGVVTKPADHAYYDPGFELMTSLLDGLPAHLKPGGRCLLAYGNVPAIERLRSECERRGYTFTILDDRDLASLPTNFLPGMLLEVRPPLQVTETSDRKSPSDASDQPDEAAATTTFDHDQN